VPLPRQGLLDGAEEIPAREVRRIGYGVRQEGRMPNVHVRPFERLSAFRRIAPSVWSAPREPNIYGTIFVRAEALIAWLDEQNAAGDGPRLSVTHAVARAVALSLQRHPDTNAIVLRGRLWRRRDIDVFVHVLVREGADQGLGEADLSGVIVRQADTKTAADIAQEIREGATRIRDGRDEAFEHTKQQARVLPPFLMRWALRAIEFLQWTLNVDTGFLGAPRDPFGSALVTSVGMLGLRIGYAPFFPLARTPLCIMVGAIEDAVVPVDGAPAVVKQLTLNATADHRVIDGLHAAVLARTVTHLLENPTLLEPA
jgi:pyruvate/2-oxoglutarate dehydrogenase complex dihydrolipoamide acyltransferase (E2) component